MSSEHSDHVSLRDFILAILTEREKTTAETFRSYQRALNIATKQLDDRLRELKEVRDQVSQDRGLFVTRETYAADRTRIDRLEGALTVLPYLLGVPGVIALAFEVARLFGYIK